MLRLVEEILAGGLEGPAPGCQEEKRTWDLVVVLLVKQTAGHKEGGWSTGYLFLLLFSS